jgi:PAS domain S-box-containing protein
MSESAAATIDDGIARRAEELFRKHQVDIYKSTDRLIAQLMFWQWIAGIIAAFVISPRTWIGSQSTTHIHVWAAVLLGGAISIYPIWLAIIAPGERLTRHAIAVGQMLTSALLIHLSGGRIETHFHVFGSLVILSFYRDWRVLIPATIIVGLDHMIRGIYWPQSVYGVLTATPWRSLEHAAWVVFEDVFLVRSCLRSVEEMRCIAHDTAQLETTNQLVEAKVIERTAEVKASEERFRLLVDGVKDYAITMLDAEGCIVSWNAGAERIKGYRADEIIGRHWSCFLTPEDIQRDRAAHDLELAAATNRSETEGWRLRKDGSRFWANVVLTAVRDENNKLQGFAQITRDITERKKAEDAMLQANDDLEHRVAARTAELADANAGLQSAKEEAEKANRAKSEFLSRMSHELRTPMNSILGFGQLLERDSLTARQQERVSHVCKAGRHLLHLINEVLDISRIESGHLELSIEAVHVNSVLREAVDLLRPLASEKQIHLELAPEADLSWHVMADCQRLKQVLLNILANAIKYNRHGGHVVVSCAKLDPEKFQIRVRDTGTGVAAEKIARLFTPFDRLGAEQSEIEGTGLGLAVSKRLVEAMGGSIGAESIMGVGSTFWIELSAAEAPRGHLRTGAAIANDHGAASSPITRRTILYIEDNLANLALIQDLLGERPDLQLMTAMQGRVGLDLAIQHKPDLTLLDLHLPDMPGWEVMAELRANEATQVMPIVAVSADATPAQIKRILAAGANDYVTKPIDVPKLLGIIEARLPALQSAA